MKNLLGRFPHLARTLARVDLRVVETPVERWSVDGTLLLAKRDDLTTATLGGNKVRALELLLADIGPDHTVLTVGPTGSTHAMATAHFCGRLGARCEVITWPQEMHEVSRATSSRLERLAAVKRTRSFPSAYLRATVRRLRADLRWIPAGGSSPLGAIGHVNAALELIDQLAAEQTEMPDSIVVPLGSGGTVAGLLVGLSIAGAATRVIAVRVVPKAIGNRMRVLRLARRTRALLSRLADRSIAPLDEALLEIDNGWYGGAYGRETTEARNAAELLRFSGGPPLDGTYSAKTFARALARAREEPDQRVLFWLTFDGRWLDEIQDPPPIMRPPR